MKLIDKITSLVRARSQPRRPTRTKPEEPLVQRRPTAGTDDPRSLDPVEAWGLLLEPADKRTALTSDFVEQLALEAFYNGPGFQFTEGELELRFLAFFDRLVESGELERREAPTGKRDPSAWLASQQTHINRLTSWWRQQGGPDIAAKVL